MIAALIALALGQLVPFRPIDWDTLPALPLRAAPPVTPQITAFVVGEMVSGKCPMPEAVDGRRTVRADVAVLIGEGGMPRSTIAHAIHCPTVEQYAAGLITAHARTNLIPRLVEEGRWYRATVVFDWAE